MFINLSSDKVEIYYGNNFDLLEKNNLERIFPIKLKEIFLSNKISSIFILNGPGSFTTLRVGTLTLNITNWLTGFKLNFYNISKIEFYRFLVKQKILPTIGIIYIGQKRKARLYDFKTNNFDYILFEDLKKLHKNFFIDKIYSLENPNKIDFYTKKNSLYIKYLNKEISLDLNQFPFKKEKFIRPNYILKPNICIPK